VDQRWSIPRLFFGAGGPILKSWSARGVGEERWRERKKKKGGRRRKRGRRGGAGGVFSSSLE